MTNSAVPLSSMEPFSVFRLIVLVLQHTTVDAFSEKVLKTHCTLSVQHQMIRYQFMNKVKHLVA